MEVSFSRNGKQIQGNQGESIYGSYTVSGLKFFVRGTTASGKRLWYLIAGIGPEVKTVDVPFALKVTFTLAWGAMGAIARKNGEPLLTASSRKPNAFCATKSVE